MENEDEKVTLASLKARNNQNDEDEDNVQSRSKIKNYTNFTNSSNDSDLHTYYCALCGNLAIITNISLDKLPLRSSDNTIALSREKFYVKTYLKKGGITYIKRQNGVEPQFRWRCDCGIVVSYQCYSYDEEENKNTQKPYIYILNEALVLNMHSARIIQELTDYNKITKKP